MTTNTAKRVSITHVSNQHNTWLRSLDFYRTELNILRSQLTEIAGKNTASPVSQEVEHYENQFKVQTGNVDTLNHDIRENLASIAAEGKQHNAGYIDGALLAQHDKFEQRFADEEKTINELRHNFQRFAAGWM